MTMAPETFLFLFGIFVAIVLAPELISAVLVGIVGSIFIFGAICFGAIVWLFGGKIDLTFGKRKYILRWFSLKEVK